MKQQKVLHIAEIFGDYSINQQKQFEFSHEASTLFGNLFGNPSIWPDSFVIFNGEENVTAYRGEANHSNDEDHELQSVTYTDKEGYYVFTIWND